MDELDVRSKKVTVIGLGNSGFNAAMLLCDRGAEVWATDAGKGAALDANAKKLLARGAHVETGSHTEEFVSGSTLVVVSPGVEESALPLQWAAKRAIPLMGEMELGYRYCKGRIIAITGTNGKSTVTTLIGEMLKAGGKETVVCGNIGNSLCGEIGRITADTWVVLEVSSFQLEKIGRFRPRIAVILNITDDHMDRYTRFDDYFNEKLKVFINQTPDDYLILNYDAPNLRPLKAMARSRTLFYSRLTKADGAYVAGDDIVCAASGKAVALQPERHTREGMDEWRSGPEKSERISGILSPGISHEEIPGDRIPLHGKEQNHEEKDATVVRPWSFTICPVAAMRIKGLHNIENVLACVLAGTLAGVDPGALASAIKEFRGLHHRVELVDTINSVEYIDDSKGTTVDSTKRALESFTERVILIAGGKDKQSDYTAVKETVRERVSHLIVIGEAKRRIREALGDVVDTRDAADMAAAVRLAHTLAAAGTAVLLSPMCSSFDMFRDYKHRGEVFKEAVLALKGRS